MSLERIFENNREWVAEKLNGDTQYFENLSAGQSPELLYIGCSDSRVTAEGLMGLQPGEVFVHRNIANMVPKGDLNSLSVIEYAVVHLKVNHIAMCGHYYCGGIQAALGNDDLGVLNPWIQNIKDVYTEHAEELDAIEDEQQRVFMARALAQGADVLLLDEPFAGVDAATEQAILDVLEQTRSAGRTLLVVHHDLTTAADYFDSLILLKQRLYAYGPPHAVLHPELLSEVYEGKLIAYSMGNFLCDIHDSYFQSVGSPYVNKGMILYLNLDTSRLLSFEIQPTVIGDDLVVRPADDVERQELFALIESISAPLYDAEMLRSLNPSRTVAAKLGRLAARAKANGIGALLEELCANVLAFLDRIVLQPGRVRTLTRQLKTSRFHIEPNPPSGEN